MNLQVEIDVDSLSFLRREIAEASNHFERADVDSAAQRP
jgi:hypothetical protein